MSISTNPLLAARLFCLWLLCVSAAAQTIEFTSQWVQSATATTEQVGYEATKVAGAPDQAKWSPNITSQLNDSLEIIVANSICVSGIAVYEDTYNGLTISISAFDSSSVWQQLWSGPSAYSNTEEYIAFSPTLAVVDFTTNKFKVDFDATQSNAARIDAIQVFGTDVCAGVTSQWAVATNATTRQSTASQANGACDSNLWSSDGTLANDSLEISVETATCIDGITIYEFYHTGLIVAISALSPSLGEWDPLWNGTSNLVSRGGDLGFSPTLAVVNYTTNKFKIDFDSSQDNKPQVDCIQVFGRSTCLEPTTTPAATTTEEPTTTVAATTTEAPATTVAATEGPATTAVVTEEPVTTTTTPTATEEEPTTTPAATTAEGPTTTTPAATEEEPTTTPAAETEEPTPTTVANTTTEPEPTTTAVAPTTTTAPTTAVPTTLIQKTNSYEYKACFTFTYSDDLNHTQTAQYAKMNAIGQKLMRAVFEKANPNSVRRTFDCTFRRGCSRFFSPKGSVNPAAADDDMTDATGFVATNELLTTDDLLQKVLQVAPQFDNIDGVAVVPGTTAVVPKQPIALSPSTPATTNHVGAIVGGSVCAAILLGAVGGAVFLLRRRRRRVGARNAIVVDRRVAPWPANHFQLVPRSFHGHL